MSTPRIAAAFASLLIAAAPAAYAETAAHTRATAATATEAQIQPDQIRASKMVGSAVYDVQNRKIGHVKTWSSTVTGRLRRSSSMSALFWEWAGNTSPSACETSKPTIIG
jgi:hypothetical protein